MRVREPHSRTARCLRGRRAIGEVERRRRQGLRLVRKVLLLRERAGRSRQGVDGWRVDLRRAQCGRHQGVQTRLGSAAVGARLGDEVVRGRWRRHRRGRIGNGDRRLWRRRHRCGGGIRHQVAGLEVGWRSCCSGRQVGRHRIARVRRHRQCPGRSGRARHSGHPWHGRRCRTGGDFERRAVLIGGRRRRSEAGAGRRCTGSGGEVGRTAGRTEAAEQLIAGRHARNAGARQRAGEALQRWDLLATGCGRNGEAAGGTERNRPDTFRRSRRGREAACRQGRCHVRRTVG